VLSIGGIVELFLGVKAEQQDLESIAKPLTAEEAERPARPRRDRYRPGPARYGGFSPGMPVSEPVPGVDLSREVGAIERVLAERGPTERRELARLVGARFWGPGRFAGALHEAVGKGRARRLSRTRFGPKDSDRPTG
jgi:hypothetical protein